MQSADQMAPAEAGSLVPDRRTYLLILSLLAASFMIFQVGVLRELRFQLNTIFTLAPFLFSSVIAFIGLGSFAARWVNTGLRRVLRWAVAVLPLLLLPLFAITIMVATTFSPIQPQDVSGDDYLTSVITAFILVAVFGYGAVFFLQGLLFALYFREGRESGILSNVYAVDLLASGAGALIGGLLIFVLTPVQMVMLASLALLVNLWIASKYVGIPLQLVAIEGLVVLGMIVTEQYIGPIYYAESMRWANRGLTYSTWSPYRRIDVLEDQRVLQVFTDGLQFHGYSKGDQSHAWDPRSLPVKLIPAGVDGPPRVLVIGAGTGADVRIIRDLRREAVDVVAVEIDEGFIRTAQAYDWLWDYYRTADIVVQEGRYYLENSREEFDMVLYAYVDPQSAISRIGLPDANFLYTEEGLRSAYARVREGGILSITRVFLVQQEEEFIKRLWATLEAAGIDLASAAMYRIKANIPWQYYGELSTIHVFVRKGGEPPALIDERMAQINVSSGGRPTTDFYPFSLVTQVWFGTLADYLFSKVTIVVLMGVLAAVLLARLSTSVGHLNFFLLGLGSFLVESLVLFNSFLLFGNPVLSAALAIGFFLVWNAIGSYYSEQLQRAKWFYALVPAGVLLYAATAPFLNSLTIASPMALRALVFSIHLAIAGIVVGAMFPISLRVFQGHRVSSMFFIDLVGCAMAPVGFWLAMSMQGIPLVAAAGTGSYLVTAGIVYARSR